MQHVQFTTRKRCDTIVHNIFEESPQFYITYKESGTEDSFGKYVTTTAFVDDLLQLAARDGDEKSRKS